MGLRLAGFGDNLGGGGVSAQVMTRTVTFRISGAKRRTISPFIYGFNDVGEDASYWNAANGAALYRQGGNRLTAYNWENNLSHAGSDWQYENDDAMCPLSSPECQRPGEAVRRFLDKTLHNNASAMLTVPIIGHVAWKDSRVDGWNDVCPPGKRTDTYECRDDAGTPGYFEREYLRKVFRKSVARKGSAFTLSPDPNDDAVYQDEFVNWVKATYGDRLSRGVMFFELDNEPDLWGFTHNRIRPSGDFCAHNTRYQEIVDLNLEYAAAIKDVWPDAVVMGPVSYGWNGMISLQGTANCDGHGSQDFYDFYLDSVYHRGQSLIDGLDFHWYPEARPDLCGSQQGDVPGKCIKAQHGGLIDALPSITSKDARGEAVEAARVQAPRSLWDPTFEETSWITWRNLGGPIRLLPRLQEKIEKFNPGMRISISEYTYGGESDISGAVAQADVLGIFAREGVVASTFWPLSDNTSFVQGAFRMYRNVDGHGTGFGDVAIAALSSNVEAATVYASLDSAHPGRVVLVAINKNTQPVTARLQLQDLPGLGSAEVFQLTSASPQPRAVGRIALSGLAPTYEMPARSVSTLILAP